MIRHPWLKDILLALTVTVLGFILAFLTDWLGWIFQSSVGHILDLGHITQLTLHLYLWRVVLLTVAAMITTVALWSQLSPVLKVPVLMALLATIYAMLGEVLTALPILVITLTVLVYAAVLIYVLSRKKHWLYAYGTTAISVLALIWQLAVGDLFL
jgi:hypothetical protein